MVFTYLFQHGFSNFLEGYSSNFPFCWFPSYSATCVLSFNAFRKLEFNFGKYKNKQIVAQVRYHVHIPKSLIFLNYSVSFFTSILHRIWIENGINKPRFCIVFSSNVHVFSKPPPRRHFSRGLVPIYAQNSDFYRILDPAGVQNALELRSKSAKCLKKAPGFPAEAVLFSTWFSNPPRGYPQDRFWCHFGRQFGPTWFFFDETWRHWMTFFVKHLQTWTTKPWNKYQNYKGFIPKWGFEFTCQRLGK